MSEGCLPLVPALAFTGSSSSVNFWGFSRNNRMLGRICSALARVTACIPASRRSVAVRSSWVVRAAMRLGCWTNSLLKVFEDKRIEERPSIASKLGHLIKIKNQWDVVDGSCSVNVHSKQGWEGSRSGPRDRRRCHRLATRDAPLELIPTDHNPSLTALLRGVFHA